MENQKTVFVENAYQKLLQFSRREEWFAFFITGTEHFRAAFGQRRKLILDDPRGAFERISAFWAESKSTLTGYLGYDLKNDLEALESAYHDAFDMPVACLFEPTVWIDVSGREATLTGDKTQVELLVEFLKEPNHFEINPGIPVDMICHTDKPTYLRNAQSLLDHIHRGDIYEVNYCIQFTGRAPDFDPHSRFFELQKRTKAPFSVFAKLAGRYVLSASPERFLRHRSGELISQPIKGTAKRSVDPVEDRHLADGLLNDEKERSENVMIVDLVRNDLSRVAARGSVEVTELFGIYSFKTVHHMISTVRARLAEKYRPLDAIRTCFPPGSMTGAPKISAMKLIEQHENFRRGCYAGGFGYFEPDGDFDLNVVIRTLLYNSETQSVGFSVGSALTAAADPEREYDEVQNSTDRFLEALKALGAATDDRFLVAVSGGVDSMGLLDMAHRAELEVTVAHVNYHLRGADSDADAELVKKYCADRNIPCHVRDIEMKKHRRGQGIQTQAREERYAWFEELREEHGLDFVLTAHHADDRLETFFINMLRGGGVRGLKSIPGRRDAILRPILGFPKIELLAYARENEVPWREDHTNREDNYLRNKIRHKIIPELADLGPRVTENLLKSVDFLTEANAYFEREADKFIASIPWSGGVGKICDTRWDYLFAHPPLPLYVFTKWGFSPDMLPEIEQLRNAQSGKRIFGNEGAIFRDRGQFLVSHLTGRQLSDAPIVDRQGEIFQPFHFKWHTAERPQNLTDIPSHHAFLDADTMQWPLRIRRWRPGDRFKPLGMDGFKKISDFLIDEKVPLPQKDAIYVLEAANGICWVVGHRIDQRFALQSNTENIIQFAVEQS